MLVPCQSSLVQGQYGFEKGDQVGEILGRDGFQILVIKPFTIPQQCLDGIDGIASAEGLGAVVEPGVQPLFGDGGGIGEQIREQRGGGHAQHQLEQVLGFVHGAAQGPHDAGDFFVQLIPDQRLHRGRVAKGDDLHGLLLTIAVETAYPLVESHRVPGQVHMDEGKAGFLQVDAFACGFGRDKETDLALVEQVRRYRPLQGNGLFFAVEAENAFNAVVAVDKTDAVLAVSADQRGHQERLGRLVFGEEENGPVRES